MCSCFNKKSIEEIFDYLENRIIDETVNYTDDDYVDDRNYYTYKNPLLSYDELIDEIKRTVRIVNFEKMEKFKRQKEKEIWKLERCNRKK